MDPGLLSRRVTRLVSDSCQATPIFQSRESCQALPADNHSTSGGSCQDPTMHSLPASTSSVPGISYQDPAVNSHPTPTNASPGGSYQPSPMDSHPIPTPARSRNPNSSLATGYYDRLASLHKKHVALGVLAYNVGEPNHEPGPVVMFLYPAPSRHLLHHNVLQDAAVPPWPPPTLSRMAYAPLLPCPPPVPRSTLSPHDPQISGIYSAIKPGVSYPLSEGFQGGREISDIDILSLYFRSVISF